MSAEDTTPVADSTTSSPTKKDAAAAEKPLFTEKEEKLLKVAMAHCLKSGPPEIDMQKFTVHGEFNTLKTAQNTWGKIKAKLIQVAGEGDGSESGAGSGTPKTPTSAKKRKTPSKKVKAAEDDELEEGEIKEDEGSPKKKRKTPVKKMKAEEGAE